MKICPIEKIAKVDLTICQMQNKLAEKFHQIWSQ